MRILVPPGIGDSAWALMKIEALARQCYDPVIDVKIACWNVAGHEARALEFVRRFSFVTSAEMYVTPRDGRAGPCCLPGPQADEDGINNYIPDGYRPELPGIDYVMIPNRHLEDGKRLEDWLPDLAVNWDVMQSFPFTCDEIDAARNVAKNIGPFVVFFTASVAGNTYAGHNRGPIWTPDQWIDLGNRIHEKMGLQIVIVGADWDRDYLETLIWPRVHITGYWHDHVGMWPIATTYAILRHAHMVISYQSGIGIVAHYLGIPTVIWWRRKRPGRLMEDSISPTCYVAHDEKMASGWARPDAVSSGRLMPCIYGRDTVDDILDHIDRHHWY